MVDRYTKFVLIIIACALMTIAAQNAVHGARASIDEVQKVQICDDIGHCAGLVSSGTT